MVKIVTSGVIPVKLGVLSVLFQGNFVVVSLIKEGDRWSKTPEKSFKYHFGGGRFHMILQSYTFSHGLCLNNFLQFWLICNQRDQVPLFRYIN